MDARKFLLALLVSSACCLNAGASSKPRQSPLELNEQQTTKIVTLACQGTARLLHAHSNLDPPFGQVARVLCYGDDAAGEQIELSHVECSRPRSATDWQCRAATPAVNVTIDGRAILVTYTSLDKQRAVEMVEFVASQRAAANKDLNPNEWFDSNVEIIYVLQSMADRFVIESGDYLIEILSTAGPVLRLGTIAHCRYGCILLKRD